VDVIARLSHCVGQAGRGGVGDGGAEALGDQSGLGRRAGALAAVERT
jgi:hypothetical protein